MLCENEELEVSLRASVSDFWGKFGEIVLDAAGSEYEKKKGEERQRPQDTKGALNWRVEVRGRLRGIPAQPHGQWSRVL